MKQAVGLFALLLFLVGCAAQPVREDPHCCLETMSVYPVSPVRSFGTSYILGQQNSATTGSPILMVWNTNQIPAYSPAFSFQPPDAGVIIVSSLNPSQLWLPKYSLQNGNYLIFNDKYNYGLGIEIKPNGELGNPRPWVAYSGGSASRLKQYEWNLTASKLFAVSVVNSQLLKGSFKAELIYSGIMNNIIVLSYREYIDDLARPAFFQEIKYDLNNSETITFKTLEIKVMKANNNEISFVVLQDGDLPWVVR